MRAQGTGRIRNSDQVYRVQERLRKEILSSLAQYYHSPESGTLSDASKRVHSELVMGSADFKRLPSNSQAELINYWRGLWDAAWMMASEWRVSYRGQMLNSEESRKVIPAGDWCSVDPEKGAHYWKGTMFKF